jgi:hypothetical protein
MNADPPNRTIEISGPWYRATYRGTAVNPEAKLLRGSTPSSGWAARACNSEPICAT